jgi:formate hydrogenlyase subunit 6/NADH:ubiquinone oxidoreductase subunit I
MAGQGFKIGDKLVLLRQDFQQLLDALSAQDYQLIGPTVSNGAIVYRQLNSVDELPEGWTDLQTEGRYQIERSADKALFNYNVGPHSWKEFLHPAVLPLWKSRQNEDSFQIVETAAPAPKKFAFIGVRACELQAIALQDKALLGGPFIDQVYQARREGNFIVAVNCTKAGGNCFCVSMQTGPAVSKGFDLALTEISDQAETYFLVEIGSKPGAKLMVEVSCRPATPTEVENAARLVDAAARQMGQELETEGLKELLYRNYENPHWEDVAKRCLSCSNCTLVCPTCFCTTFEETSDLSGEYAGRLRKWDSCFNLDFSFIHGGSVRISPKSRYRQWLVHKFAAWVDQFDSYGCVGCGRCITWCPVGINLTREISAIRASESTQAKVERKGE